MRRPSTLLSLTITASIMCSPLMIPDTAYAGAPAEESEDPALTEAKRLYKEGEVKFQTAEYEDALALWKSAFGMLPEGDQHRAIRHALVYNIAEAHSRAYEVSRNPTHLRKAKILLDNYRADHRALFGDEPAAVKERSEVDDRIAELDKRIAESEAANEVATPLTDPASNTPAPDGGTEPVPIEAAEPPKPAKPLTPQQQWEVDIAADPVLGPKWAKGKKRLVAGSVLTGIGGLFAIISVSTFLVAGSGEPLLPGLWVAGGVVTGVFAVGMIIPGGVLIGTGIGARRAVLRERPKPTATLVPMLNPYGGGVGFVGQF